MKALLGRIKNEFINFSYQNFKSIKNEFIKFESSQVLFCCISCIKKEIFMLLESVTNIFSYFRVEANRIRDKNTTSLSNNAFMQFNPKKKNVYADFYVKGIQF